MREPYYSSIVTVERDGKQWEVIISMYSNTRQKAIDLITNFIERYKNTDLKVITTRIEKY